MRNRRKRFKTKEEREKASQSRKRGWETRRRNGNATWGHREEPDRLPAGTFLETITRHGADGSVRRMVIRQGRRKNLIRVDGMRRDIGYDELFQHMRTKLSKLKPLAVL